MKIGLFFGSFNPIHIGHLIIANAIVENADVDKVWFVVSPQSPFKKLTTLAHEFDRYDMVKAAIQDNENFDVTDIEFKLPKPSFTVDTLAYLQEKHPKHQFKIIMGEDNLVNFHKWKNADLIKNDFGILVYPRPNTKDHSHNSQHPNVSIVDAPMVDISATHIRKRLQESKSIRYLVHPEVELLLRSKKLYL